MRAGREARPARSGRLRSPAWLHLERSGGAFAAAAAAAGRNRHPLMRLIETRGLRAESLEAQNDDNEHDMDAAAKTTPTRPQQGR